MVAVRLEVERAGAAGVNIRITVSTRSSPRPVVTA